MADHATSVVTITESGRYQQTIKAGSHTFFADQPTAKGGQDTGPAPYDLLLASLGACTSQTLRMYAERKQLPLAGVSVSVSRMRIDVEGQAPIERLERTISLTGDLTAEQKQRMLEIADKCPIARTLKSEFDIVNSLA